MIYIRCFLLLFLFSSCRVTRVFENRSTPTTFEGDSLFFEGIGEEDIGYNVLSDIFYLGANIKPNQQTTVFINHPTIFVEGSNHFIVYPGEHIIISIGEKGQTIFKTANSEQRNREFLFHSAFQTLEYKIRPQFPYRTRDYPVDSVLKFEEKVKSEIPAYIVKMNALFDSLAIIYRIGDEYKKLVQNVKDNRRYSMLHYLYFVYSDVLKENNLYQQKQRELLPQFDRIKERDKLYLGASYYVESIGEALMQSRINKVKTDEELKEAIDTVNTNFHALSRDFLLTKLVYTALYRRVPISKRTMRYYYRSCKDPAYQSVVRKLAAEQKDYARQAKAKKDNRLISLADDKVYTLEEVIAKQKGKLILLDIWAAGWCMPCLEQYPYMDKLKQQFAGEKISFIYLSLDRHRLAWKIRNEELGVDPNYSYIFENFDNQSFLKNNNVEAIPRYILIDQNGKIINADAPAPDTLELDKLIRKHLQFN